MAYAKQLAPYTAHLHIFNWKVDQKYPLLEAKDIGRQYLGCFSRDRTLLLEFMPDERLETLAREALALKEIAI